MSGQMDGLPMSDQEDIRRAAYAATWRAGHKQHIAKYNRLWSDRNLLAHTNATAEQIRAAMPDQLCTECKSVKLSAAFALDRSSLAGLDPVCRECRASLHQKRKVKKNKARRGAV